MCGPTQFTLIGTDRNIEDGDKTGEERNQEGKPMRMLSVVDMERSS